MLAPLAALVAIAALGQPAERALRLDPNLRFRLVTGTEWDTNAPRSLSAQGPRPESDGLVRMLLAANAGLAITNRDYLSASYVVGAKRFFDASGEDLIVHQLSASTSHGFGRRVRAQAWGDWRQSRMRNGVRDYTLGSAYSGATFSFEHDFGLNVRGGYGRLGLNAVGDRTLRANLSHRGPQAGAGISWGRKLKLSARVDQAWRNFQGNALKRALAPDGSGGQRVVASFCDGSDGITCDPERRRDTVLTVSGRAAYRGRIDAGGEITLRNQRSNSVQEDFNRLRVQAFATVGLPFELVLNVIGSVQFISQVSLSQTIFGYEPEDDENQNSLKVHLNRPISDDIQISVRYELFANQFATNDVSFLRQTLFVGLSLELDSQDPPPS